jgi:hypothetical protein
MKKNIDEYVWEIFEYTYQEFEEYLTKNKIKPNKYGEKECKLDYCNLTIRDCRPTFNTFMFVLETVYNSHNIGYQLMLKIDEVYNPTFKMGDILIPMFRDINKKIDGEENAPVPNS